jgi:Ca-activated chloride channel homolog
MSLIQPAMLGALVALPLILLLYILRPRHRRLVVPSVRLWQHLPSDLEGRPRWRLPVVSVLLLAQLLIAGAIAFALARPALPGPIREHLIVLLDTSPTMLATDAAPDRLDQAVQAARQLASALKPDDQATLIAVEPSPRVLATGKGPRALDGALSHVTAAPRRGDVVGALLLAAQTAQNSRDTHNRIVVLSDGAFGNLSLKGLGPIPADVSFQAVGGSDDNQAITAVSARPMIGTLNRFVGFVQVTNYASQSRKVAFSASADGLSVARQTLDLPARGHVEVSLPLPVGTQTFAVGIDAADKFSPDNQAQIFVPPTKPLPVTLVAVDPGPWERALRSLPSVQLKVVAPGAYKADGATLTILNNFVPAAQPAGNLLLVAPPRGNPLVPISGELDNLSVVHTDENSPLFDAVDLAGLYIPHGERFATVPWATSVADSSQGALILSGEQNGRRIVVLGFDPATTEWPQRISFPVFVSNLVGTLTPSTIPNEITAGTVIDLPAMTGVNQVAVQLPSGKVDVFDGGRPIRFTDTGQLGRYSVA